MTGASWGSYQDYLYGRFDGINHEDEAQTDRHGNKISHGGDVYYMCPGRITGDSFAWAFNGRSMPGSRPFHLEEPEFWVRGGYSEGFKREWRIITGRIGSRRTVRSMPNGVPPNSSTFFTAARLQQVFDYVQDYNRRAGRQVRCYVPTHSLLTMRTGRSSARNRAWRG